MSPSDIATQEFYNTHPKQKSTPIFSHGTTAGEGGNTMNAGGMGSLLPKLPGMLPGMFGTKPGEMSGNVTPNMQKNGVAGGTSTGFPGTMTPGGGLLNTTQKDPQVQLSAANMNARYNTLAGKEGQMDPFLQESITNLRNRQNTNTTQRAMDQANAGAADQAAGMQSTMQSQAARTGRGSGWGGAEAQGAGQRLAAGQDANIQKNELQRQDALTLGGQSILGAPSQLGLAKSGQTNNMLLGAAGYADQGAKLGLAQQGLGLEQWKAGNDASYKQALLNQQGQQGMFDNYLKLMSATGY